MPITREEVIWGYRMILDREPESEKVIEAHMHRHSRSSLREAFLRSPEFKRRNSELFVNQPLAPLISTFTMQDLDVPKLVFLHHPKTGGTTLHHILATRFKNDEICPERFNGLRRHPVGALAKYRYFSGHFDLPSIKLIPGKKKIITMLRDPVDRLISLYYFQRAHKPEVIERNNIELARLANQYSIAEFFRANEIRNHPRINNSMTRILIDTVAGERWERMARTTIPDCTPFLTQAIEELENLDAFGILERYNDSVRLICTSIGIDMPDTIHPKQVLDTLIDTGRLRQIEKEYITEEVRKNITELVLIDIELYRHACSIFERRLAELEGS